MKKIEISHYGKVFLNHLLLVVSLLLIVFCTSCASVGRKFDLSQVQTLRIGETTMAEVRALFGNPLTEIDVDSWGYKRMHFGDEETKTIWRYSYAIGTIGYAQGKFLQVDFDQAGRVSDYYYSSDFGKEKTEEPEKKDFDIFQAKEGIVPGKTKKTDVISLLGDNYRMISIDKPGTAERWHYGFTGKSKDEKVSVGTSAGAVNINKIYGKSLDIDFDSNGSVVDIRGESDFPADKDRFFTEDR